MDTSSCDILRSLDIDPNNVDGALIQRDVLLNDSLYNDIQKKIPDLKKRFSSSYMTSLHKGAKQQQKWPLLNLVRQILHTYNYQMKPIRKSDGYTPQGVKKYKRYFLISKIHTSTLTQPEVEPEPDKEETKILTLE
jgi:hypothetical protein